MLSDEFRVNHRAASESLLRAVSFEVGPEKISDELQQAKYFESEAMNHVSTPRQRALGMGLLHTIDMISAVSAAEFLNE